MDMRCNNGNKIQKITGFIVITLTLFFTAIIFVFSPENPSSETDTMTPTYESFVTALGNPEINYLELDSLILKILSNSSEDDIKSLILNDYTKSRHFIEVKKSFDDETLNLLIKQNKINSQDTEWILEKTQDSKVLISIYRYLNNNDLKKLEDIGQSLIMNNMDNFEFISYLNENPSESPYFNSILRESFLLEVSS